MTTHDAEVSSLRQALALAKSIGSATSYADIARIAVQAFDDGTLHSALLLTYEGDRPGLRDYAHVVAGWRRGTEHHPLQGARLALAELRRGRDAHQLHAVGDTENAENVDEELLALARRHGTRAAMTLPLLIDDEPTGLIYLGWPDPQSFAPATLQLAETLMSLAPGVVQRIGLIEEARVRLEELQALRAGLEAQVSEQTTDLRTFKAIVDSALDAIAIATPSGVLVYGNPAFAALSGFGDAVVGSAFPDYFIPEDLPKATGEMLPALLHEGVWKGILHLRRPDGSIWTSDLNAFALLDSAGRPEALAGVFRDITEEHRRNEELARLNQRLEQSFVTSPLAMIEADDQGIIIRWNPAAEQIFGWPAEEAIGKNLIELLVPGLAREHVEGIVKALLSGEATNSRNVNQRKDGRLITCQWHNAVLRDSSGRVLGWLSQVQDITEQLRAEEDLRESSAYLRAIFNAMSDIVLVIDSDGTYRNVAPTQPELRYGHSANLVGKKIGDISPPEEAAQYLAVIREVLATGEPLQHTYTFPGPEGITHFNATVSRLSERSVLWVARDVTAQLRAENERAQLQEQVIAAQQAALRELSTPIIPIGEGVVAMPLIGSVDTKRAEQVIESLLSGVAEMRAATAILDITGVPVVDTQVANALLQAAQAVKLLGAQVVLTGIRPEVAQTLVGLGLDLSGITTLATLESGIRYAFSQARRRRR